MADFVQKTVNKTALRDLTVPIATLTSFNNLIDMVIEDNPFGCVGLYRLRRRPRRSGRPEPRALHREGGLHRRRGEAGGQRLAPVPDDRRVRGERRGGAG